MNKVDSVYDSSIKRIFMGPDNASIVSNPRRQRGANTRSSKNSACVPSYKIARTQSDRGKMDVDAKESHR